MCSLGRLRAHTYNIGILSPELPNFDSRKRREGRKLARNCHDLTCCFNSPTPPSGRDSHGLRARNDLLFMAYAADRL